MKRNLVHDTLFRRLRGGVASAAHRLDATLSGLGRKRKRVLFEAASPVSLAVFRPIFDRLAQDARLEFWFTSCDAQWDAATIFGRARMEGRIASASAVRWRWFDLYINADFWSGTWLPRRPKRIHLFHGVAGKYDLDTPTEIAPAVAAFDRLFFANEDRRRRYIEAGLVDDSPQAALIGYPKVDCLVDGSLDAAAIRAELKLDPKAATVLYAPTWSPYSSLNSIGEEVIAALVATGLNVIVKLHDRSCDGTARGSGSVDWLSRLARFDRSRVHIATDADASPYLYVADALVTDHSSVGFEYMLMDRPIVVLDCPQLIEQAKVNQQKVKLLRSAATVAATASAAAVAVSDALAQPDRLGPQRRAVAAELFYRPGTATARAVSNVYDLLHLPAPEVSAVPVRSLSTSFTHPARNI